VGIMVAGGLKCTGTLQHLKNKFGTGFEVQLRVSAAADVGAARAGLEQLFGADGLAWSEIRGTKMAFALPQTAVLSSVFERLGAHTRELGVEDYTVSQSSIEQVFLRIAAEALEKSGD
jgi:ATP-binding cassette subfamily A (ABC1) protein 3